MRRWEEEAEFESQVLGLTSLRFGAEAAVGVEIDPDSIVAAHSNARLNGMESFKVYLPSSTVSKSSARQRVVDAAAGQGR